MKAEIIYEDKFIIAVNKPPGLICRPENFKDLYLIHRLDKDTSGVLLLAKRDPILRKFQDLFRKHLVHKTYLGLFFGYAGRIFNYHRVKYIRKGELNLNILNRNEFLVEGPIKRIPSIKEKFGVIRGGRPSQTRVKILRYFKYRNVNLTLMNIYPISGRTHQIRVILANLGHPLVGDVLYGQKKLNLQLPIKRQFLHAASLSFRHPLTGGALKLEAPVTDDIKALLKLLKKKNEDGNKNQEE